MRPAAPQKRPELTLDELHQVRWLLGGILTVLALITSTYIDVNAWALMIVAAVMSVASTLRPTLPARMPRLVHVLAFPVMAAFFALDIWLRAELLPAMVRLDMLLLLYRTLVYRQRRDDLQIIVLGLFLVVVAGVLTVSVGFAAHLLIYTAAALLLLLVLTLIDAAGNGATSAPGTGEVAETRSPPGWALHVSWLRLLRRVLAVANWRLVALAGGLFGGVIAGAALLFLLIPRFPLENGMFLNRFMSGKARTGFSDSIKFGDVTEIQQDTSVALHIDVGDGAEVPLNPYWRMLVLDDYTDGTFRLSPSLRRERFSAQQTGTTVWHGRGRVARRGTWRIYMEAGVSRYLPMLGPFRQSRFAEAQTYQHAADLALIALSKDPVTMVAYQVEGFNLSARLTDRPDGFYSGRLGGEADDEGRRNDSAALQRVLQEIGADDAAGTAGFADRVSEWLRNHHAYSLSPRFPEGTGDPLVRWLDSREAGHCELFAGSFVLLAREAGYPARVVTGFRGGTWNAFSDSFTVRNSDAHAWAEIYDPASRSWLRADPLEATARARLSEDARAAALDHRTDRSWAARMDSLRVFWYRRVVSFDDRTQVHTLKTTKELAQAAVDALRRAFQGRVVAVKAWSMQPWGAARVVGIAATISILAAIVWAWRRLRPFFLQWLSKKQPNRRHDPIRREAGRWLRRIAQRKAVIAPAPEVMLDLQRLRFGARETWPDAPAVFRRARAGVKGEGTEGVRE